MSFWNGIVAEAGGPRTLFLALGAVVVATLVLLGAPAERARLRRAFLFCGPRLSGVAPWSSTSTSASPRTT